MINILVTVGKLEEKLPCQKINSEMSKCSSKCKQSYVDHPRVQYQPTWPIHGIRNSLVEFEVLNNFGDKYAKIRPFKE